LLKGLGINRGRGGGKPDGGVNTQLWQVIKPRGGSKNSKGPFMEEGGRKSNQTKEGGIY